MTPSSPRPKAVVTVRRSTVQDAAAMARMMGEPSVLGNLMQMPHTSEELWRARLTDNAVPGKLDLPLVAEVNGEVVGSAGLHPVGPAARRRHAMMLGILVAPSAQGQGVGTALMAALCDYADNWLGILRMELDVYSDNLIAQSLYKKFGFELEGTHRAYAMRNGVYVDSLSMARFHPKQPLVPAQKLGLS
jgi:L-phenylalanine/L-methionine N-acetyltransferase